MSRTWGSRAGRRLGASLLLVAALHASDAHTLVGQTGSPRGQGIARSTPPPRAATHRIAPGERYRAGGLARWLLGSDYRRVWTMPLEVPVLDLDTTAGGLTPRTTGGFGQSITLELTARDGSRYAVRSLDKDPTRRLIAELRGTLAEKVIRDQIHALLPTAGLVVDPLQEATGILHAKHRLVVVPRDPRLGEHGDRFAGLAGMLVSRPREGPGGAPGFAGSRRVVFTDSLRAVLRRRPCDRVDARAYLKARLLDLVVGDRDRHPGQWRWARFPAGECHVWSPIPEDRDQAFVDYDGLLMWVVRRFRPQQIRFGPDYPNLTGLTFNAWELDRELLAGLDWPAWDTLVAAVQRELTDPVIEDAVRRLPGEHYELVGQRLEVALKSRRDGLGRVARSYYRSISGQVEVSTTDAGEFARLEHGPRGDLEVRIAVRDPEARVGTPLFRRRFHPDVTREVRLYLRGGDDVVEVDGDRGRIRVRVIGGEGDDRFVNASRAGGTSIRFYDAHGENRSEGRGSRIDGRPFQRPPGHDQAHRHALDWGGRRLGWPTLAYSPDLGLQVGLSQTIRRYGFRKVPFRSNHRVHGGLTSVGPHLRLDYDGRFRHLWPAIDGRLQAKYSGLEIIRFHGFGNATVLDTASSFFEVERRQLEVAPSLEWNPGGLRRGSVTAGLAPLRPILRVGLGPVFKLADTPLDDNADRFIGRLDPAPPGTGAYTQLGARLRFAFDSRDRPGFTRRGVLVEGTGTLYPAILDVESGFGEVHGTASTYLSAPIPTDPTLALRAGGKRVWGAFPFHEAAYLGGADDLRGFREQRFAGDAALFGNAELRLALVRYSFLVPTRLGVHGVADVGRVFFDQDPDGADAWHAGFGGGLWLAFVDGVQSLSLTVVDGDDLTGLYLTAGFTF